MARHNRTAHGEDQHGRQYAVEYQPDWLEQVKVTRDLESGRQSTKVLYRNTDPPASAPGAKVRTRLAAPELGLELELATEDPGLVIRRIVVEAVIPRGPSAGEPIQFALVARRSRAR